MTHAFFRLMLLVTSLACQWVSSIIAPSFSPTGGDYGNSVTVVLVDSNNSSSIHVYYTLDGTVPSSSSNLYVSPIELGIVGMTTQISCIAVSDVGGGLSSSVSTATYNVLARLPTPVFSPGSGSYLGSSIAVAISLVDAALSSAMLYYTTDGTNPTASSTSANVVNIGVTSSQVTLKAFARKSGWADSLIAASSYNVTEVTSSPTFSPNGGQFADSVLVTLASSTPPFVAIYYTTDGSNPSTSVNSKLYNNVISLGYSSNPIVLSAIAQSSGRANSTVSTCTFQVKEQLIAPTFNPASGNEFSGSVTVTMSTVSSSCQIHFTTDGSTPTASSQWQPSPCIVNVNQVGTPAVKAIAVKNGALNSPVASATYSILQPTNAPVITPSAGTYLQSVTVTLACSTLNAKIYYTTDGTNPSPYSSPQYTSPINVNAPVASLYLKVIALSPGLGVSAIASMIYTVEAQVAKPTFSPPSGTYPLPMLITIASASTQATLRYTTNGADPTILNSYIYTSPVLWNTTSTILSLAARGFQNGIHTSDAAFVQYNIQYRLETPNFYPASGSILTVPATTVTLMCSTPTAVNFHVTTNGSAPSQFSAPTFSPITLPWTANTVTIIRVIATADLYWQSFENSATYIIQQQVANPIIDPPSGTYPVATKFFISSNTFGATVYFTSDGSDANFNVFMFPVVYNTPGNFLIKAYGRRDGWTQSGNVQANLFIQNQVPPPVILFPSYGSKFVGQVQVTISPTMNGSKIYYSATLGTNSSTPFSSLESPLHPYTDTVTLSAAGSYSVLAKAVFSGWYESLATRADFTVVGIVAMPTITPCYDLFVSSCSITLTTSTKGAGIRYFLNDELISEDHNGNSTTVIVSLSTPGNYSLLAIASHQPDMADSAAASCNFTLQGMTKPPEIIPAGGYFLTSTMVTLQAESPTDTVWYTTDGTDPLYSRTASAYSDVLVLLPSLDVLTIKAASRRADYVESAEVFADFQVIEVVQPASVFPPGGSFGDTVTVTIQTATPGSYVLYTTTGEFPAANVAVLYRSPVVFTAPSVISNDTYVAFNFSIVAYKSGAIPTDVATFTFFVQRRAQSPILIPNSGYFISSANISAICPNHAIPSISLFNSVMSSTSFNLTTSTFLVKATCNISAVCLIPGSQYFPSLPALGRVVVIPPIFTPVISPPTNGIYTDNATVSILSSGGYFPAYQGTILIKYSLDGSNPLNSSSIYNGQPMTFQAPTNITFKAVSLHVLSGFSSSIAAVSLDVRLRVAAPVFLTPASGVYPFQVMITLLPGSGTPSNGQIFYTTDGSNPTPFKGITYSTPFLLTKLGITSVKCITATPTGISSVVSAAFDVRAQLSPPSIHPASGIFFTGMTITMVPPSSGIAIEYTMDGSKPSASSSSVLYAGPISVATLGIIRINAVSTQAGSIDSAVVSSDFTILSSQTGCSVILCSAILPGYHCAPTVTNDQACVPACGDGIVVGDEQCDDGNTMNGDGCSSVCTVEPLWTCNNQTGCHCSTPNKYGPDCSVTCIAEIDCSGRGTCEFLSGNCVCNSGYFGTGCAVSRSALSRSQAQIGNQGGSIQISGISLQIPGLNSAAIVTAETYGSDVLSQTMPESQQQLSAVSDTVLNLGPHGLQFSTAAATLTMQYNSDLLQYRDEQSTLVNMYTLNERSGNWEPVPGRKLDIIAGTITAPLLHFSLYAIFEVDPNYQPSISTPGGSGHLSKSTLILISIVVCATGIFTVTALYLWNRMRYHRISNFRAPPSNFKENVDVELALVEVDTKSRPKVTPLAVIAFPPPKVSRSSVREVTGNRLLDRRNAICEDHEHAAAASATLEQTPATNIIVPKTADERAKITQRLTQVPIFAHMDKEQLATIADAFFRLHKAEEDIIIRQGDEGDRFYILDEGECAVTVMDSATGNEKLMGVLHAGDSFGELALLHAAPRAATVRALSHVCIWGLDRKTFLRLTREMEAARQKELKELLSSIPILSALDTKELASLVEVAQDRDYDAGDYIIKQGENGNEFFILVSGTASAVLTFDDAPPKVLCNYSSGDYFGEKALIEKRPRAVSVVADSRCCVAIFDCAAFDRLLGPCIDILKRDQEKYQELTTIKVEPFVEAQSAEGVEINAEEIPKEEFETLPALIGPFRPFKAMGSFSKLVRGVSSQLSVKIDHHPKSETDKSWLVSQLESHWMFAGKKEEERLLSSIADAFEPMEISEGQLLFEQGGPSDKMIVIPDGKTVVLKWTSTGVKEYACVNAHVFFSLSLRNPASVRVESISGLGYKLDRVALEHLTKSHYSSRREQYVDILSRIPILEYLQDGEIRNLADALVEQTFEDGEYIIRQGDHGSEFYILLEGEADVWKTPEEQGEAVKVFHYNNGGYFGEVALLKDQPRTASVIARGRAVVGVVNKAAFDRILGPALDIMNRNIEHYHQ